MAPAVPVGTPGEARAGDTWLWRQSFSEYTAAEGWTPAWHIRGKSTLDWASAWAVAVGEEWTVTIPAASTLVLAPGAYEYAITVTGSGTYAGRVHTVETGRLLVRPDLEAAEPGDRESWAEQSLSVVEGVLSGRITDDIASYTIGGRQVVKMPFEELMRIRNRLRAEVAAERFPGQIGVPVSFVF